MTKDVICNKGKCEYEDQDLEHLDNCVDCDEVEQIEHDLLKEQIE